MGFCVEMETKPICAGIFFYVMSSMSNHENSSISEEVIQQWISEVKSGKVESYRKIVDYFSNPLQTIIFRMVLNWEDAQDLAQEVFIQAYRSIPHYEPRGKFQSWLYRIGTCKAIDHLRAMARQREGEQKITETFQMQWEAASNSLPVESRELGQKIEDGIRELNDEQRVAFVLYEFEQQSYQQIAESLNTTVKSVEMHIYRARNLLREKLKNIFRHI